MNFVNNLGSRIALSFFMLALPAIAPVAAHDIGDGGAHIHGEITSAINEPIVYGVLLLGAGIIVALAIAALKSSSGSKKSSRRRG